MSFEKFDRICRAALIAFALAAAVIVLGIGTASGMQSRRVRAGAEPVRTAVQDDPVRIYVPDSILLSGRDANGK